MFKLLNEIIDDIVWPLVWVVAMWLVFFISEGYDLGLNEWGIRPRSFKGLVGVLLSPFLHGDFEHLFSNTVPFLVSGYFLYHFFPKIRKHVMFFIFVFAGLGVWLYATNPSNHIGASGMVYGMISFLITHGNYNKNKNMLAVSMILIFLYGGLIYGIFPQYHPMRKAQISWEGHLAGMLTGIILGIVYRREGPQKIEHEWMMMTMTIGFMMKNYIDSLIIKLTIFISPSRNQIIRVPKIYSYFLGCLRAFLMLH